MRRKWPRVPRRTGQEEEKPPGRRLGRKGLQEEGRVTRVKRCVRQVESWAADLGAGKAAFEARKRQTLNGNSAPSLVTLSKSLFLPGLQFHHHKRGAKASSTLRIR